MTCLPYRLLRRRWLLLLPVVAVAATACSQPLHVGTAATVGTTRISEQTLRAAVESADSSPATAASESTPAALTREVLGRLITDQLVSDLASRLGVTVTQQQVNVETVALASQAGGTQALDSQADDDGIPPSMLGAVVRTIALESEITSRLVRGTGVSASSNQAQSLLSEYLLALGRKENIDVNPRFGSYSDGNVVAATNGNLASPAPDAPSSARPDTAGPSAPTG